ncbi:hypothetical protein ILUMI_20480 [Ignelater luminosus]|uniref:Uncharacterized protein n=1 Tax=Ignelater luminosus TaxID=2038154 RepID=A0A8K0CI50_IGNLU|nr:hypothetical protein ILUMI_20480 [Ignelater luminosus]
MMEVSESDEDFTVTPPDISEAATRDELMRMTADDIEDMDAVLIVKVPYSKTEIQRTFKVILNSIESMQPPSKSSF